jgi:lipoprotein-releasing system ATP-binding protein
LITLKNINKKFGNLQVLKDVSLNVNKSEIVSIVGASGAGKTTLLQIMGTLDKPDSGIYFFNDMDVLAQKSKQLANFRNKKIGFIFQFHQLLPEFTALENVCLPAWIGGANKKQAEADAKELLSYLKLSDRITHKPAQLSGGEQQRVAVARALINKPDLILADEPSGNLDSKNANDLHQLFFDLRKEFSYTFVIVTHNTELANLADRKLMMADGKIVS